MEWNGRRFFHIPYWQFSSIPFPFHIKNLPCHIPFHTKILVEVSHANALARAIAFLSYIWFKYDILSLHCCKLGGVVVMIRGGVEDTRLEAKAKAKDTKKIRGQGQGQPFRGQTLSRPRTGMLEAKAKDKGHKRKCSPKKKKVFTKIFQTISTKERFPKNFSSAPQNFNNSKNTAVLEPRTGQFSRT